MRRLLPFILLFISLGCQNDTQNQSDIQNQDVSQTQVTEDSDTIRWNTSTWYKVRFQELCDDRNDIHLDMNKLDKYGTHNPYDTVSIVRNDSIFYSFDFISDCCLEFNGEIAIRNDTLILAYGSTTVESMPCDCYCDYRMNYSIYKNEKKWNGLKIKRGEIN